MLIKEKDPERFTIPLTMRDKFKGRDVCDLGASINMMSLTIFKKLGITS